MLAKSKELLSLKTLVGDRDFIPMLDRLLDAETYRKNASAATDLQDRMSACLEKAVSKCQSSLCANVDCPRRKLN